MVQPANRVGNFARSDENAAQASDCPAMNTLNSPQIPLDLCLSRFLSFAKKNLMILHFWNSSIHILLNKLVNLFIALNFLTLGNRSPETFLCFKYYILDDNNEALKTSEPSLPIIWINLILPF